MSHAYKPKWSDFYAEGLGPSIPLSNQQMTIPISGVLPSGESNGFDSSQLHGARNEAPTFKGSGINVPYPYPNTSTARKYAYVSGDNTTGKFSDAWWEVSGILKTYPSNDGKLVSTNRESGILHYNGPSGRFSNGEMIKSSQITDFTLFNNYVHHELMPTSKKNGTAVTIPYISTFKTSINWNPYG